MITTDSVIPCVDCFHFKTVLIRDYNIKYFYFMNDKPLQKELTEFGHVKVWFCKMQKLPKMVYISRYYIHALTNMNCPYKNI